MNHSEREILECLQNIHYILEALERRFRHRHAHRLRIEFRNAQGEILMPVTMHTGQTVTAAPIETDAVGASVAITDPTAIAWTSSDTALVSVSKDDNSGGVVLTAVAAGIVTITVTDPANSLTASDTVTVNVPPPPPATHISIEFGVPA